MAELRRREKEQGLEPDWEIDAFMRASALHNKRQHIMTDYMLRLLGLEVCPFHQIICGPDVLVGKPEGACLLNGRE